MTKSLFIRVCVFVFCLYCVQVSSTENIDEKRIHTIIKHHLDQPLTVKNISSIRKTLAQYILNQEDIVTPYLEKKRQASRGQLEGSMTSSYDTNCVTWRIVELDHWGTSTNHLFDVALICQMLRFSSLAKKAGKGAIRQSSNYLQLLMMAEDFYKANLNTLSSRAANKGVQQIRASQEKPSLYQSGNILLRITENELAEEVYVCCLQQQMNWQYIFDIYKKLKKLGKHSTAKLAFDKLLESARQEKKKANNFFYTLYIAQQCAAQEYYQDCKLALKLSIEDEQDYDHLWSCIENAHFYKFDDLRTSGVKKLVKRLRKYPYYSFEKFKIFYLGLLQMGESQGASQVFRIAIKNFKKLFSFPSLVELIAFIKDTNHQESIDYSIQHAIKLCKPQDAYLFDISLGAFVPPSSCLLIVSQLSQRYARPTLALQAADLAIDCALAEFHESPENLLQVLNGLKTSLKKLQYRRLVKKVSHYKEELENPTFNTFPTSSPELFSIYWLCFKEAQGAEIQKFRPWIVIKKPTSYNMGDMVTIVPLSTKRRGGVTSIPIWFKDQEQEIRLDQVKSVDTSRLTVSGGELSQDYHSQLLLAYKNLIGK